MAAVLHSGLAFQSGISYTTSGNPTLVQDVAYEYKIGTNKEIHPHAFHLLVDSIVRRVEMVVTKRDRSVAALSARGKDATLAESTIVKLENSTRIHILFHSTNSEERDEFVQAVTRSLADMGIEGKSTDI